MATQWHKKVPHTKANHQYSRLLSGPYRACFLIAHSTEPTLGPRLGSSQKLSPRVPQMFGGLIQILGMILSLRRFSNISSGMIASGTFARGNLEKQGTLSTGLSYSRSTAREREHQALLTANKACSIALFSLVTSP